MLNVNCGFVTNARATFCRSGVYTVDDVVVVDLTKKIAELEKRLKQK